MAEENGADEAEGLLRWRDSMTPLKSIAYSIDRDRTAKDHALRVAENCKRFRPMIDKNNKQEG